MKWDDFVRLVGDLPLFDLVTAVQLTGEPRNQVSSQLWRWSRAGKVTPLRRGLYALCDPYRKARLSSLQAANEIYRPSYLSRHSALSLYGLIPEAVPVYQSVTTRVTRFFENTLGRFQYSSLKSSLFWGATSREIDGCTVMIAEPEKALLDTWYLSPGEWTVARLREMRLQQLHILDSDRLARYTVRCASPRIRRAWERLSTIEADR